MLDNVPSAAEVYLVNEGWQIPLRAGDMTLMPNVPVRVPLEVAMRFTGLQGVRIDWSPIADCLRTRTDDGRPVLDFWAPMSAVDGYGIHALNIHRGLAELGADVMLRASELADQTIIGSPVWNQARDNRGKPPAKVAVAMSVPRDECLTKNQSVVKIAITQWETDHIPTKHVEHVNRCNHLITTSNFQPPIWKKSGLHVPISVLTPGIDTDFFAFKQRPMTNRFRVLILGALSPRKNTEEAIRIFWEASQRNPDWRMTIKSRGYISEKVKAMADADSRIEWQLGDAPAEYIRQLYYDHDCFLWPSKGEGVGLPPLEAMATGMELVCSDNSGMSDYVYDRICYPIKTAGLIPADAPGETWDADYVKTYGPVGNYWQPDRGHAIKQLSKCFDNWLNGKRRGEAAAKYVREHHTLRHQAESVLKVVEGYL